MEEQGATEFTTISLLGEAPQASDRRSGERYMTVLQAGKLVSERFQELCLIRNISSRGMMAEVYAPLTEGEEVAVEFRVGIVVGGVVRWIDGSRLGIEFAEPIDVHEVLAPRGGQRSPRAPRLSIDGTATIEIGEEHVILPVFDISQGGVKVACSDRLERDLDVVVRIGGLPSRAGVVRWNDPEFAGISFNQVLSLEEVAYWASRQKPRETVDDTLTNAAPGGHA